jgi:hypothetical protein
MRTEILKAIYNFKVDKTYWNKIDLTGDEHNVLRSKPAPYIKKSIEIAKIMGLKTLVEIGSTRYAITNECLDYFNNPHAYISPPCCNDGHAGIMWANEGFDVHTVDIDHNCLTQLIWSYENINKNFPPNLHPHIPTDGIEFLTNFNEQIDVLYLDGWDVGTPDYQKRHLESFIVSRNKLSPNHLIIIDDTDFKIGGQGKDALLSPYLIESGYHLLFNGRQTLYINKL